MQYTERTGQLSDTEITPRLFSFRIVVKLTIMQQSQGPSGIPGRYLDKL